MIAGIYGVLEARTVDAALVNVHGLVLRIMAPSTTLNRLGALGEHVSLFTHLYVREDNLALYGFSTADERDFFELLLSIGGFGPKVALNLLSASSPASLRQAVAEENVQMLTLAPGIGKKLASRLILELKGKLPAPEIIPPPAGAGQVSEQQEVLMALTSLGYSMAEAQAALKGLPEEAKSLEDKVVAALRYFAK